MMNVCTGVRCNHLTIWALTGLGVSDIGWVLHLMTAQDSPLWSRRKVQHLRI